MVTDGGAADVSGRENVSPRRTAGPGRGEQVFMSDPAALALARVLDKTSFNELPPVTIKHAKMILASTLASAAAGVSIGSVRIIRELAKEQGGKPEAPLWFDGARNFLPNDVLASSI